jgi:hypothetical protein
MNKNVTQINHSFLRLPIAAHHVTLTYVAVIQVHTFDVLAFSIVVESAVLLCLPFHSFIAHCVVILNCGLHCATLLRLTVLRFAVLHLTVLSVSRTLFAVANDDEFLSLFPILCEVIPVFSFRLPI